MYSFIGLGNPGSEYALTPHNVGFMVCDLLSFSFNFTFSFNHKLMGQVGNFVYGAQKILVLKPCTYMNLSGNSVLFLVNFYKLDLNNIIVIHDDMDLDIGVIRIKKNSSSGGHRGVQSIIDALQSKEFIRIKIGIGRKQNMAPSDYVLSTFSKETFKKVENAVEIAKNAALDIVDNGPAHAMNIYNKQ